jgi:hypothetical protein
VSHLQIRIRAQPSVSLDTEYYFLCYNGKISKHITKAVAQSLPSLDGLPLAPRGRTSCFNYAVSPRALSVVGVETKIPTYLLIIEILLRGPSPYILHNDPTEIRIIHYRC